MGLLRRRAKLIGGVAIAVVLVVAAWSLIATPVYSATATLFVSITESAAGTEVPLVQAERIDSYAEIATGNTVLDDAAGDPDVNRSVAQLESQVSAVHPQNSVLIRITARDDDPDQASAIANAVGSQTASRIEQLETPAGRRNSASPIRVSVAQPARTPSSPSSPKVVRNIFIAIVGGLLLGLIAAVLKEMFDRRLRDPAQIRDQFDLPVLTEVDFDPSFKDSEMFMSLAAVNEEAIGQDQLAKVWQRGRATDEFRRLRVGLQFFEFNDRPSVMVTSSVAAEGKTTTAGNLAVTTALAGESTVVVDCDLRRPSVASELGVSAQRGLTDLLIGRADLDSTLVHGPRLSVLASGPQPPNPTELLGSQAMADLMEQLHERFERVVLDTPPCPPCADASVLASLCGATLLVVRIGSTTYDQLDRSISTLESARARISGIVANMVKPDSAGAYGYAYYGRGEGGEIPSTISPPAALATYHHGETPIRWTGRRSKVAPFSQRSAGSVNRKNRHPLPAEGSHQFCDGR